MAEQPGTPPPPPSAGKVRVGAVLSLVGGLVMFVNGISYFRGGGNNLLTIVGAGLMIAGMGMRGGLNRKL